MIKEQLMGVFMDILAEKDILKVAGIHEENHKPHPFMVSPKHIREANEKNEGIITEEICEKYPCGKKNCKIPYSKHTSEKTLVLQLKRDVKTSEAHEELIKIKPALTKYDVLRVGFADTEEGYKFIQDGSTEEDSD